jgi:hypothetical protein
VAQRKIHFTTGLKARTVAESLSDVHEALQEGEGVSGPAARRLVLAAAQQQHRFGGMIATVR